MEVIRQEILRLTNKRGPEKSVCPSEIGRALFPTDWRKHMDLVRQVGLKLHNENQIQICQKGIPLDLKSADISEIKGPIRFRCNKNVGE